MHSLTANEAKTRFGEMLDLVQREPVQVTKHDRVVGVMVSVHDYEQMRGFYADRLRQTLSASAQKARQQGLTSTKLGKLLSED